MQLTSEERLALSNSLKGQDHEKLGLAVPVFVRPANERPQGGSDSAYQQGRYITNALYGRANESRRFISRNQASKYLFVGDIVEVNTGYGASTAIQAMVVGTNGEASSPQNVATSGILYTKLKVLFRSVGDGGAWESGEVQEPTPFTWNTYFTNIRKLNGLLVFDQNELDVLSRLPQQNFPPRSGNVLGP